MIFMQFHFELPKAIKIFQKVICELAYKVSANTAKILIESNIHEIL